MLSHDVEAVRPLLHKTLLPAILNEAGVVLSHLAMRGHLAEIGERVRVRRRGGYVGIDAFLFLLVAFSLGGGSLRHAWARVGEHARKIGALASRDSLMSPASLSRLLGHVDDREVDTFARWLLRECSGVLDGMRATAVQVQDASRRHLHVFAFDPTRLAIRQRSLPVEEDLPEAERSASEMARPGHVGRKRGEVVTSIGVLEHMGTGAVLDVTVYPGNGDTRAMFRSAATAVVDTMAELGRPIEEALLLADGEFGSVPHLDYVNALGLPYISRCSRYELLDVESVRERMLQAPWHLVEDSLSGPRRHAADLGTFKLPAGESTRREDGTAFDPVEERLVVSRHPAETNAGRGYRIGDQNYELFVCHRVPATSMPAPDVVTAFYVRSGQECRFNQRQSDLNFQYAYSRQPAGLRMALVVAFFLWNFRIAAGSALRSPLPEPQPPTPRVPVVGPAPDLPRALVPPRPESVPPSATAGVVPGDEPTEPAEPAEPAEPIGPTEPTEPAEPIGPTEPTVPTPVEILQGLDWTHLLRHRPGWRWDPSAVCLVTDDELAMVPVGIGDRGRRADLRFRGDLGEGRKPRQGSVSIPAEVADALRPLFRSSSPAHQAPRTRPHVQPATWFILPAEDVPLPYMAIRWPEFLPASARDAFLSAVLAVRVDVRSRVPKPVVPHDLIQPLRARRQHRRLTWTERVAKHAAPMPVRVRIRATSKSLVSWLSASGVDMHR